MRVRGALKIVKDRLLESVGSTHFMGMRLKTNCKKIGANTALFCKFFLFMTSKSPSSFTK